MKLHSLAAELLGVFLLSLAVFISLTSQLPLSTPVIAALTVGVLVYTMGSLSGAHLNPAVTVGLASVRAIGFGEAAAYIVAQFVGGYLGMIVGRLLTHGIPQLTVLNTPTVFAAEAIGAAILVIGVSSVVRHKCPADAAGLTIGGSLLLGILIASTGSNGVLNPAVAFGIGSVSVAYVLGPIVGGIVGAWIYKLLCKKD